MSESRNDVERELIWTIQAETDLRDVIDYIQDRSESAADRMRDLFHSGANRLARFPYAFRAGRVPGTREAVLHPNYLLIFKVDEASVTIVNLLHARRQYP